MCVSSFRVLRVGGHLVLLLSLQLSAQLKKTICTQEHHQNVNSLDTNNLHTDPSNTQNESTDTPKPLMFPKSSSEISPTPLLISSLQAQRTHRVSLGSTDAFIHIYTKIKTQTLSHWNKLILMCLCGQRICYKLGANKIFLKDPHIVFQ